MSKENKRLLSLDILRGITIAGMLLVNNPGTWSYLYRPLAHAEWIGLSPTDLVFPFFIFCMGVSMAFSLKKFNYKLSGALMAKVVRRTVVLFLIGWAVQWFGHLVRGLCKGDPFVEAVNNLDTLRYLGVFQRLALVYFFGSLCVVLFNRKFIPWLIGLILVAYALILGLGNGYDFSLDNIIARIDNSVLGTDHMYHESVGDVSLSFDPEGILSTLPCVAHVLIGYLVGRMILSVHNNTERVSTMLLWGAVMLLAGWLLQYGIPCGKKMWSSTFVMITCGMAMCIQAMLIHFVDIKGKKKGWGRFFESFGVNPLALYLIGTVLAILFGAIPIGHDAEGGNITVHSAVYQFFTGFCNEYAASALYAVCFVLLNWAIGHVLYKKKIYIKL
ncbi:MAG: DUF5009 domain-containing protein [Muribaculaceae bacterium]|nr:DUF5009 domain-containing protein [Muribaculaceae bacterium]